ncbi:hypothetical protein [Haloglycomyces albus]|uniref:hypothetical protein n=1 Tax=Haloglycomyces albus TaxID=526067 RepID=UPI00046CCEDF|nr:hypothetical protein [Haloglycomyces albus]
MSFASWYERRLQEAPPSVKREVLSLEPTDALDYDDQPIHPTPILLVPDAGHEARDCEKLWLPRLAAAGRNCAALNLRGQGQTPADVRSNGIDTRSHDIVQTAISLRHQAVVMAFGDASDAVLESASRYPTAAVVLLNPTRIPKRLPDLVGGPSLCFVTTEESLHDKTMTELSSHYGATPLTVSQSKADLFEGPVAENSVDAVLSWLVS